jgi:hypothetical protein
MHNVSGWHGPKSLPPRVRRRPGGRFGCLPVLWSLGLVASGCAGPDQGALEGPPFIERDSAGVHIAETRATEALRPLRWAVGQVPNLELGKEGDSEDHFFEIGGMKGLPDGGVLVVDGGSQELRFFDAGGTLVRRAGGGGQGPGEFRRPALVPVVGTDSLLVFDRTLPWAQVLAPDGTFGRMIRHVNGRPYGARAPVGAVGFRHMLFDASGTTGGAEAPIPPTGITTARRQLFWYDTVSAERTNLPHVDFEQIYRDGTWPWMFPFYDGRRAAAVVSDRGAFVSLPGWREIAEVNPEGQVLRILRVSDLDRPVTDEHMESFFSNQRALSERLASLSRRDWDEVYGRAVPIPDQLPLFTTLQRDAGGWLWAALYHPDPASPTEWIVFDPDGRARGTVETPAGLAVQWIGEDAILGVHLGSFGEEIVRRHRLDRGSESF